MPLTKSTSKKTSTAKNSTKSSSKILAMEHEDLRHELIQAFAEKSCFDKDLILPSGKISNYDLDLKEVLLNAEYGLMASLAILNILDDQVEFVGGHIDKACTIAPALAQVACLRGRKLDSFLLRDKPKQKLKARWLDGALVQKSRVCIAHDLAVDGLAFIEVIRQVMEQLPVSIIQVIALVDKQDGTRERLRDVGIDYTAIITMDEILRVYKKNKKD